MTVRLNVKLGGTYDLSNFEHNISGARHYSFSISEMTALLGLWSVMVCLEFTKIGGLNKTRGEVVVLWAKAPPQLPIERTEKNGKSHSSKQMSIPALCTLPGVHSWFNGVRTVFLVHITYFHLPSHALFYWRIVAGPAG